MPRLILVRHGRASQGWEAVDPPLDDVGVQQAKALADVLGAGEVHPIVTSPMRRCRETAAVLGARWQIEPVVEPAVAELPSPEGVVLSERPRWLQQALALTWCDLGDRFTVYRAGVLAALAALEVDTVVVSHFVPINAVIGAALGRPELVILRLDNASRTIVDSARAGFTLVQGGDEADTLIR